MKKFILLLLILIVGGITFVFASVRSLPSWYDEQESAMDKNTRIVATNIEQQGVGQFLGNKISDVLRGRIVLSEEEFNVLLMASLKANEDGRKLLQVSDGIHVELKPGEVEIGAVINLDKVEKIDARAREIIEKVSGVFPFLNDNRMSVALIGTPIARNGELTVKDDFRAKVGFIPLSNDALRQLGVKVNRVNQEGLALKNLTVQSVKVEQGRIEMKIFPKF